MSPAGVTRSFLVAILVLLCLKSSCAGGDITKILKGYPDLSKMTDILSQPDVAKQMNSQPAVTILALDNNAMDALSAAKQPAEVTDIVKCHVGFDYYDEPKLNNRPLNKPVVMVNLFQSSGSSQYGQGMTQIKKTSDGIFFFSSSTNSTRNDAKFVEKIYTRQFNVSIVKIDHPISILGLNDDMAPARPPVSPKAAPDTAPGPAPEEEVVAEGPSDDTNVTDAPAAAPSEAPAPDADVIADAPTKEKDGNSDDEKTSSAGKRVVGLAIVLASAFLAALSF